MFIYRTCLQILNYGALRCRLDLLIADYQSNGTCVSSMPMFRRGNGDPNDRWLYHSLFFMVRVTSLLEC